MADKRTLTVSLVAEVASLKKGMNEARNSLGMLQKSSQATASVLRTAFAGAATVMAFQAVSNGIRNVLTTFQETATAIEDTKHLADALGATTQEIQVLQRAAQLAEVDMDMLNRNVKMLTKNLGNASLGTGPAKEMLDRLGMSAQELIQMPLPEQLAAIGQRMQGLGSAAQRVAVATALFGKSGTDMIPFLMQASGAISEIESEMMATGELFSDSQAAAVDEMGDSLTMAMGAWNGLKNEIVIGFAPAVNAAADMVRQFGMDSSATMRENVAESVIYVSEKFAELLDNINKIKSTFYAIGYAGSYIAAALVTSWNLVGQSFNVVMTSIQELSFRVFHIIAKGLDMLTGGMAKLINLIPGGNKLEPTNAAQYFEKFIEESKKKREQAFSEFGSDPGGVAQSWLDSAIENERRFMETYAKESTFGDKFRELMQSPMDTMMESPIKEFYDDSMDILQPLEEEKKLREDINGIMGDTVDMQKELSKDFGEGAGFRAGEYTPPVGSVTGGVPGVGNVGVSGAAMGGAGRGGAGGAADGTTGLLQGILDATRLTAINTGRASVPVYG